MLFNSSTYLLAFLPTVVLLYWYSSSRTKLWIIFLASVIFYGFWRFDFVPLVLASALLDYVLSLKIAASSSERRKKQLLLVSLSINLCVLIIFKYLIFFSETFYGIGSFLGYEFTFVDLKIILPLGISFYIFQTISYTFDVYRGEIEAERDLLKYMCFVIFFAQMVAGPILRAGVLLPQIEHRPRFELSFLTGGVHRILVGLFLKVVLADTVADYVDEGFLRSVDELSALDVWTLAFLFGFQIYFDFAGYSHIAIGSAQLLGIRLPENFNFPYISKSPREFWQRWHISLSTWIRDYLYIPLIWSVTKANSEGSDVRRVNLAIRRAYALFLTWLIMGLWHGANWTFAVWGLYHAALIQGYRVVSSYRIGLPRLFLAIAGGIVTLLLSMAGWIPFRAENVSDAIRMWGRLFDVNGYSLSQLSLAPNSYLLAAALLVGFLGVWTWQEKIQAFESLNWKARFIPRTVYFATLFSLGILFLQVKAQFIYFQF